MGFTRFETTPSAASANSAAAPCNRIGAVASGRRPPFVGSYSAGAAAGFAAEAGDGVASKSVNPMGKARENKRF